MRIIKIIAPNKEIIKLEISGIETEIRDLISTLSGISSKDIKGLRDKYGNYFTLSFASTNSSINSDFSEYYYLVCSNNVAINNTFSYNPSYHYGLNNTNHNLNNNFSNLSNIPNYIENYNSSYHKSNNLFSDRISTGYYNNNSVIDTNNKVNEQSIPIIRIDNFDDNKHYYKNNNIENRFDYIIKILINSNMLKDNYTIEKVINLVNNNNEGIIKLFISYENNILSLDMLCNNINSYINSNYNENISNNYQKYYNPNNNNDSNVKIKNIHNIYSKLINDSEGIEIINTLLENNDEMLHRYYNDYTKDSNDYKFAINMHNLVNKYKNNIASKENVVNNKDNVIIHDTQYKDNDINCLNKEDPTANYSSYNAEKKLNNNKNTLSINTNSNNNVTNKAITSPSKLNILNSANKFSNSIDITTPGRIYFNNNEIKKITDLLHSEQKFIFKYAVLNKAKEIETIYQMKMSNKKEEEIINIVKIFCNKYIQDNLLNNLFTKSEQEKYNQVIKERNCEELKKAFKEANPEKRDLSELKLTIKNIIQNLVEEEREFYLKNKQYEKNEVHNNNNQHQESNEEENQEDDNANEEEIEELEEEEEEEDEQEESNGFTKEQRNFIKTIKSSNWMKDNEKELIIKMIENLTKEGITLLEDFERTSNILTMRNKIKKMLKSITLGKKNSSTNSNNVKVDNFKDRLMIILNKKLIKKKDYDKIIENINKQNKDLLNIIETSNFTTELDIQSLSNTLKKFIVENDLNKTPVILAKTKQTIKNIYNKEPDNSEKNEIKNKLLLVLDALYSQEMLDKETLNICSILIEMEHPMLVAAFETLSVTMMYKDFCETITTLSKLEKENNSKYINECLNNAQKVKDDNEIKLNNNTGNGLKKEMTIFDYLPNIDDLDYGGNEINILNKLVKENYKFLFDTIELYKDNKDEEDLKETLDIIIKKSLKN